MDGRCGKCHHDGSAHDPKGVCRMCCCDRFFDDGGHAFPSVPEHAFDGMSLRDYFASRAPITDTVLKTSQRIAGDRTESQYDRRVFDAIADYAYGYADAMLDRRQR
jgi:hypothetical protein